MTRRSPVSPNVFASDSTLASASTDMDGRAAGSRPEAAACARCIARLTPAEVGRANWRLTDDCRRCREASCEPAAFTEPFCKFMSENPTVFHAAAYFRTKLEQRGFTELPERDGWHGKVKPGGKYWVERNGSCLAAFVVGRAYKPGDGVAMVGCHLDALTARLKPVSKLPSRAGYVQLGVAPYAGALDHTWWDRDLGIGGRVIVRDEDSGATTVRLVKVDWPVAKIPTLAPHFGVDIFGGGNKETRAVPIIGLDDDDADADADAGAAAAAAEPLGPAGAFVNSQPPRLVRLIARQLGLRNAASILSWDLELFDCQPAQTCGLDRELISAGRIDDRICSWAAVLGLLASADGDGDDDSGSGSGRGSDSDREAGGYIRLVALFDNEEIGSLLRQGARSNFLPLVVERAVEALSPGAAFGPGLVGQTYARSFLLSADVTHAGNPNFLERYLDGHVPRLNVGLALKCNASGHTTTDAASAAVVRRVADLCGARVQLFQIRNDSRSGGTIGPALSSAMGVRSADAGIPQLSMHSVRETTGALDPGLGVRFFKGFFDYWEKVDGEWRH